MNTYKKISVALSLALSMLTTACEVGQIGDETNPQTVDPLAAVVQNRYVVLLDEGVSSSAMLSEIQSFSLTSSERFQSLNGFIFSGPAEAAEALAYMPGVKLVEPDQVVFAELPTASEQPGFCEFIPDHDLCSGGNPDNPTKPDLPDRPIGEPGEPGDQPLICSLIPDHESCDNEPEPLPKQITPWGITAVGGPGDAGGRTAWVIDTGIDLEHADLNVDVDRSRSFLDFDRSPGDQAGHGTHVAGTIGAIDNEIGVIGVAPGVSLVSLRVLDQDGRGSTVNIVKAIDHLAQNAKSGDVANLSLTAPGYSEALDEAIKSAASRGILFAIAAGNNGEDASNYTPASIDGENIYTIAAVATNECITYFSNFGAPVDFSAPGLDIESTQLGGGTHSLDGTSMAAPHVAGILLTGTIVSSDPKCENDEALPEFPLARRAQ